MINRPNNKPDKAGKQLKRGAREDGHAAAEAANLKTDYEAIGDFWGLFMIKVRGRNMSGSMAAAGSH